MGKVYKGLLVFHIMKTSLHEAQEAYEVEIGRIVDTIKKEKAKNILLQFPENMKPFAPAIASAIEEKSGAKVMIWLGSCWGACDIPRVDDIDLIVQFGHAPYNPDSGVAIFS